MTGVPLSEIITISRHVAASRIESFMNEAPPAELFDPPDFLAALSSDIRVEPSSQPCPMGIV